MNLLDADIVASRWPKIPMVAIPFGKGYDQKTKEWENELYRCRYFFMFKFGQSYPWLQFHLKKGNDQKTREWESEVSQCRYCAMFKVA